jgi:uncharacterized glyoxalase superfamily protein PhnB
MSPVEGAIRLGHHTQALARLQREDVPVTMPLTVEAWGERAFQVTDPNGVIVQLVDWNGPVSND